MDFKQYPKECDTDGPINYTPSYPNETKGDIDHNFTS